MSQDSLHRSEGARDQWLQRAFDEWDAGEPSAAAWEEINTSLSTEAVWERVGQSLTTEEHAQDQWIADAHDAWEPEHRTDGWARLNDAISLEQVWRDLNHSLDRPVRTRLPIWKLAAACVAALFLSQHFSDSPLYVQQTAYRAPAGETAPVMIDSPVTASPARSEQLAEAAPAGHTSSRHELTSQQSAQDVQQYNQSADPARFIAEEQADLPEQSQELPLLVEATDETIGPLTARSWEMSPGQVYPTDFTRPSLPFTHWTIQFGTQLSILQARQQASLTSTLPHFGLAADVSMRHRVGPVQLIHALGVSRYAQGTGGWDNGRYFTTDQRLTMLQFSSAAGYSHKRFTFYGGLLLSKMLTGVAQNKNNAVTDVYYDRVQTGFTGGIDYRLKTFASGNSVAIGSQYQWLKSVGSDEKTSFENIQAIRFQAKFSF